MPRSPISYPAYRIRTATTLSTALNAVLPLASQWYAAGHTRCRIKMHRNLMWSEKAAGGGAPGSVVAIVNPSDIERGLTRQQWNTAEHVIRCELAAARGRAREDEAK